jgi:large subunit ribosomal protein L28
MKKRCYVCGKHPVMGNRITYRGLPKKKKGVGLKITGCARREFKPNLQHIHVEIKGKALHIWACVKCIKAGKVKKALKKPVVAAPAAK